MRGAIVIIWAALALGAGRSRLAEGADLLHVAAQNSDVTAAEMLLAGQADVNAKDYSLHDWTPLHWACYNGHAKMSGLLLSRGADVNAKARDGKTPLHEAARGGSTKVAEWLLSRGADVNLKDNFGKTPLHDLLDWANSDSTRTKHEPMAEWLLAHGADANVETKDGKTPLHEAARGGTTRVAEWLVALGADVNARDHNGCAPPSGSLRVLALIAAVTCARFFRGVAAYMRSCDCMCAERRVVAVAVKRRCTTCWIALIMIAPGTSTTAWQVITAIYDHATATERPCDGHETAT
jgi:ankyrin repeat protein